MRLTRREFIILGGKVILGVFLSGLTPLKLFLSSAAQPSGRRLSLNKFPLKIIPFRRSILYKKHNLAG